MVDAAVALREQSLGFLQQRPDESSPMEITRSALVQLGAQIDAQTRRRI
jgi:hypothetical protein